MKFCNNFLCGINTYKEKFKTFPNLEPSWKNPLLRRQIIMRINLIFVIVLATMLQVSASSYGQKINITQTNISLNSALKLIRAQSGYDILFDDKVIQKANTLNLNLKNAGINEALKQCLEGQNLTYSLEEHTILIKEKSFFESLKENISIKLNDNEIIGYVFIEKTSEALAGATVMVKRTKKAVYTNAKGIYTLKDVLPTDTLVFSYIGYINQYVAVKNAKNGIIYLKETTNVLDAVVIQGYGKTTQRLSTGNIVRITADDIGKQILDNPILALQGVVPGLEVKSTNGNDAGIKKVELRGRKSINANFSSEPLYIVDGVPLTVLNDVRKGSGVGTQSELSPGVNGNSPLYSISPGNIESIEVLKDADATAIYGSRGGNGVILITTKKGKPGKTVFNAAAQQGIRKVISNWDLLNTQQYLEMRKEAFKNDGVTPTSINAPELLKYDQNRYTDWQDYSYGKMGKWSNYDASLSGGNAQTTFRIASSFNQTKDISTLSGINQRFSTSSSISHRSLDQKLSLDLTASYSVTQNNTINLSVANLSAPNAPAVFDEKGDLNFKEWQEDMYNFSQIKKTNKIGADFLNAGLNIRYNFFKDFTFSVNLGYNSTTSDSRFVTPLSSYNLTTNPKAESYISTSLTRVNNLIAEPLAEYRTIIGRGKLELLFGGSYQNNDTKSTSLLARGFASDEQLNSINNATSFLNSERVSLYKYAGIFARINYIWDSKYILNLNARRDGSSKFGPDNRFGNFGSLGAAWILSEEKWVQKYLPTAISLVKLKASTGVVGSDGIGDYQYLTQWGAETATGKLYNYDGVSAVVPLIQPNNDFHWQKTKKTDVSLNLAFFKDKVNLNFGWYSEYIDNQLLAFTTPSYTGFTTITLNSPAQVRNTGLEFSLSGQIINTKNFSWNSNFSYSKNKNKLVGYENFEESPYYVHYKIGQSLNNYYVFKNTGVNPTTGERTYFDYNGDGKTTANNSVPAGTFDDDRGVAINTSPDFFGAMGHNFRFKNLSLSANFTYAKQKGTFHTSSSGNQNISTYVYENTWRKPGDVAIYSKFTNKSVPYFSESDANYVDADYIRLQTLQLAYALPASKLKYLGISNLSVNVTAQNIFVITNYKGLDPEVQSVAGMPQTRTITMGLNCSF